ncbi:MAG: HAD family hydrolase [Bacteroidales bacterium]|jgi:putative hydrolase of the HAD superfamily|nr:HAD family hydrolase [Bacteroidales bacterium]MDD4672733.1 HAD family hydrolase [Bacteroidales bacterium]MDY0347751.1 HAD family hydrolase [Tenuifilaceae bacterium]
MKGIKVIAFDADDTLWVNEPNYQETEKRFCDLLASYLPKESVSKELFKVEMSNLPLYGYGAKGFMLSMIETLIQIVGNSASLELVQNIIQLGKELLEKPVEILPGAKEVLIKLNGDYRLVVATKGDLLDQERKLSASGLVKYFHHIEIMSDKKTDDYIKLLKNLGCSPESFLMVGNSLKSDIIPVLELGAYAVHVPFHTTWAHEQVETEITSPKFAEAKNITELLDILS